MYIIEINNHIVGLVILLVVILGVQIIVFVRIVSSIKSRIQDLKSIRDEAIQSGKHTEDFEKAFSMLDQVQREKLLAMRETFWGKILKHIFTGTSYEKPSH